MNYHDFIVVIILYAVSQVFVFLFFYFSKKEIVSDVIFRKTIEGKLVDYDSFGGGLNLLESLVFGLAVCIGLYYGMVIPFFLLSLAVIIDSRITIIPDIISYSLLWCGITNNLMKNNFDYVDGDLFLSIFAVFFLSYSFLFSLKAVGGGDVKLLTGIAPWCSHYLALFLLMLLLVTIILSVFMRAKNINSVAYAPFIFISYFLFSIIVNGVMP